MPLARGVIGVHRCRRLAARHVITFQMACDDVSAGRTDPCGVRSVCGCSGRSPRCFGRADMAATGAMDYHAVDGRIPEQGSFF